MSQLRAFGAPRPAEGFLQDQAGSAAVEFVLWLAVLVVPVLSAVDLGVYTYQKMQLEIAAQSAAQAVWHACDTTAKLPATKTATTCGADLMTTIRTAAQSTSLGTSVTVSAGSPVEGYYCASTAKSLQLVGSTGTIGAPPTKPAPFDCHTVTAGSTTAPGDYIQVTVAYNYSPVFKGISMATLLPSSVSQTAWMRLN